jgi:anti-sigma B factor antagonist
VKIATAKNGNINVVEVSGELTWDSAARFTETVDRAFADGQRDFVVDLSRVETIDSTGLEALTALQRRCDEQLGMVRFSGPRPDLRKIFELTRLNRNLAVDETMEDAMASIA